MTTTSTCPGQRDAISLDVFVAGQRPDLTALYCAGRAERLGRYVGGLGPLEGPLGDIWVVLARGPDGRAHGGMRVHLRRPGEPLPVERALGERCPIGQAVARAPAPLVELCGTWVGPDYRGQALAAILTPAALAVARALGARCIVGCAHQHIFALYQRFGAVVDLELGVHPYPDARYETRVFWADPKHCADKEVEGRAPAR